MIGALGIGLATVLLGAPLAVFDLVLGAETDLGIQLDQRLAELASMRVGIEPAPVPGWRERCGPELACLSRLLAEEHLELGLLVSANLRLTPPLLSVQLFDAQAVHGKAVWALDPAGPGPIEAIMAEVARLLERDGHAAGGRIRVEVSPAGASIAVDDQPPKSALSPGPHRVHVWLEGFEERAVEADVVAGKETVIPLQLDSKRSLWASPWFWIAASAVVLIGGGAAGFAAAHPSGRFTICQGACR
jgi:hypothetical protein